MSEKSNNCCLIFAHRGAPTEAFENTRSAFDQALTYPIDGMETDVQLSRDRVAVLWHDWLLDKVGLPGKRIGDLDFKQLQALDFSTLTPPVADSEGLMTLQAFVESYHKQCRLLLELKIERWHSDPERHEALVRACCDIAKRFGGPPPHGAVLLNSFDLDSLVRARRYCPSLPLILNLEQVQSVQLIRKVLQENAFLAGLCLPIDDIDNAVVAAICRLGKTAATYTCNSEAEITKALTLAVDILITDVPPKALALRSAV
jgi:glycerophosphoryl diester phosphodiesterase